MTRGYFGIGIWHPKHEINMGTLWRSALCFGASFIYTVGQRYKKQVSDTSNTPSEIPLYNFQNLEELKSKLPFGCPLIGVELTDDAQPLKEFCHPRCANYLLGAEDHGLSNEALKECHYKLVISGLTYCLNVAVAGSIVMYDRMKKI